MITIIKRVLETMIRSQINIDDINFGFMPGSGTTAVLARKKIVFMLHIAHLV